jgi:dTDP-4-amino-4,6-dideoxygalactose transaminase
MSFPTKIPFNKPFLISKEMEYIRRAVEAGQLSGGGFFTQAVHQFFQNRYNLHHPLLTTSCTDALELAALLLDIQPGDEVILPAFTFVSTANAFALRGAKLIFADSQPDHPNIDTTQIERLITPRTRAIVCVHYAGMACDLEILMQLAEKYKIVLIEDAAHAIESTWKGKQLGTLGSLGTFSFHETKNIMAGEGGLLCINDRNLTQRARIIYDKGTNRQAFLHGQANKYEWTALGSSFAPSELIAAYLLAQLEEIAKIQTQRLTIWNRYQSELQDIEKSEKIQLPKIPQHATSNGHIFYLICQSAAERQKLMAHSAERNIQLTFHYQALHQSPYFAKYHDGRALPHADRFSQCLVRLPVFYELTSPDQTRVIESVKSFYGC